MKKCLMCEKEKKEINFYRKGINGIRNICKECYKIKNKKVNDLHNSNNYKKRKELSKKLNIHIKALQYYGINNMIILYKNANNKCELCGKTNKLSVHHIDGSGIGNKNNLKINNNPNNLLLLCSSCHGKIHGKKYLKNKVF